MNGVPSDIFHVSEIRMLLCISASRFPYVPMVIVLSYLFLSGCEPESPTSPSPGNHSTDPPIALATVVPDSGTTLTLFKFDGSLSTSGDTTDSMMNYKWDFGDGTPLYWFNSPVVPHQYLDSGSFNVTLIVRNIAGIMDTTYSQAFVREVPEASIRWIQEIGSIGGTASALDSEGYLYFPTKKALVALNGDGSERWRYTTNAQVTAPAISANGTLYFGSGDDNVYAVSQSGDLIWNYETGHFIESAPAVALDGTIYIGSTDNYLYALSPEGNFLWKYSVGWTQCSPVIGPDGTIYIGSNGDLVFGINPDGTLKWSLDVTGGDNQGAVDADPALSSDGTLYVSTIDGYLWAIDTTSGTTLWSLRIGDYARNSPVIGTDGTVYVCAYCNIEGDYAVSAIHPDGYLKWRYGDFSNIHRTAPLIADNGIIYFGANDPFGKPLVAGIDTEGELRWYARLSDSDNYGVPSSSTISDDGAIYFQSGTYVIALESLSNGLADTPWPKARGNLLNTGRFN
ncbi:PQQ-binding-like beta-propeller repeat protein [Gemmatimonadota bacterium]